MKALLMAMGILSLASMFGSAATAEEGLVTLQSVHPVPLTVDRLERALKNQGFTIFARIDHGAGAERVAMALPASELLIFGKPAAGTVLMQATPAAGIDLPLKYLVWADAGGGVTVGWNDPLWLAECHGIDLTMPLLEKMRGNLERIASEAAR
ncbi:DUF302 domain-containing protein [Pseudohaliea sp.]|uniref:DUF302 domain-containing protein n=1 Tax=Pseudohaliea sp. TaxID=2740289 RepID=UPI0032EFBB01